MSAVGAAGVAAEVDWPGSRPWLSGRSSRGDWPSWRCTRPTRSLMSMQRLHQERACGCERAHAMLMQVESGYQAGSGACVRGRARASVRERADRRALKEDAQRT